MSNLEFLSEKAIALLKSLIATPSYSKEEDGTANLLMEALQEFGFEPIRTLNNVWAKSANFDPSKPTILLNSHHDTVKAGKSWNYDPFIPTVEGDKLTGLGSNDAGGPLVSLLYTFIYLNDKERDYNLIFAGTAEEENSGINGVRAILDDIGDISFGIVGEPTQMKMAIAEKGLVVLDCEAQGKTGHAARNEGENAIYKAMQDIEWFKTYQFPKVSEVLGAVHMCVTQIEAGQQHNVVPDSCSFVVDVRTNEHYTNEEAVEHIREHVLSEVKPRSLNLCSSQIALDHPVVQKGKALGLPHYGSAAMSDQVHMPFPTLKIGPGDTRRSHTPDEFIYLSEIKEGIQIYINLLEGLQIDG